MAKAVQQQADLLQLPGEIRNSIWRHIAVYPSAVFLSAGPQADNDHLVFSPRAPSAIFTCRAMYDEVRSIYYEENSFHFTEYALTSKRLRQFRERAGPSAQKLTKITITRAFGVGTFAGRLQFSARIADGRVVIFQVSSDAINCPWRLLKHSHYEMCSCQAENLAQSWQWPLLDFVGEYLTVYGNQKGGSARIAACHICNRCRLVRVLQNSSGRGPALYGQINKTVAPPTTPPKRKHLIEEDEVCSKRFCP